MLSRLEEKVTSQHSHEYSIAREFIYLCMVCLLSLSKTNLQCVMAQATGTSLWKRTKKEKSLGNGKTPWTREAVFERERERTKGEE